MDIFTSYPIKYHVRHVRILFTLFFFIVFILGLVACEGYSPRCSSKPDIVQELGIDNITRIEITDDESIDEDIDVDDIIADECLQNEESDIHFITQAVSCIDRIVILLDPNWGGELTTFYITEEVKIESLYNLLAETQITYTNKHPAHYQSIQSDSEFIIRFEYNDGRTDEFSDFNRQETEIFRFLDTRGVLNDPGFIVGKNERIWEFIDYIKDR